MRPDPIINRTAPRQIPVASPSLTEAEAQAAADCVRSGRISQGPLVEQFEREFAAAHGQRFGVACSSGTMALTLALAAAGVEKNSRVVMPTLTMVAVGNASRYLNAIPVFVDSELHTGNPEPTWPLRALCHRPDAVIAPGLYGIPAAHFIGFCRERWPDVPIVEDLCECPYAGMRGDFGCYSLYGNKIVSGGEGGCVLTDNEAAAERMRSLRSHAFSPDVHFVHSELAFACRWTDLQASIALAQHHRRAEMLAARERIYQRYREALVSVPHLTMQPNVPGAVRWVFPVLMANEDLRDRVRARCAERGIETRSYFVPLHRQKHLRQFADRDYPIADGLSQTGLYLPLYVAMSDDDVDYVAAAVRSVFE